MIASASYSQGGVTAWSFVSVHKLGTRPAACDRSCAPKAQADVGTLLRFLVLLAWLVSFLVCVCGSLFLLYGLRFSALLSLPSLLSSALHGSAWLCSSAHRLCVRRRGTRTYRG